MAEETIKMLMDALYENRSHYAAIRLMGSIVGGCDDKSDAKRNITMEVLNYQMMKITDAIGDVEIREKIPDPIPDLNTCLKQLAKKKGTRAKRRMDFPDLIILDLERSMNKTNALMTEARKALDRKKAKLQKDVR